MNKDFLKWAKENDLIRPVEEIFTEYPPEEEWHKGNLTYLVKETTPAYNISIGDIVFVENFSYQNDQAGKNHLFVIIEEDNTAVALDYFGLLISSQLAKLKYKENILLKKATNNNLKKDSLVKTDYLYKFTPNMISYKIGSVTNEQITLFKECLKTNYENKKKIEEYIIEEKSILDKEFELLQELSKLRKEKNLSQRDLADLLQIKQPMLAKIEKHKNSPQLNTLLKILDSLGYTIEFKKK